VCARGRAAVKPKPLSMDGRYFMKARQIRDESPVFCLVEAVGMFQLKSWGDFASSTSKIQP